MLLKIHKALTIEKKLWKRNGFFWQLSFDEKISWKHYGFLQLSFDEKN